MQCERCVSVEKYKNIVLLRIGPYPEPNRNQPRKDFDEDALNELAKHGRTKTRIEFRAIKDNVEYLVVGFVTFNVDADNSTLKLFDSFT